jgi:hypothetical protein
MPKRIMDRQPLRYLDSYVNLEMCKFHLNGLGNLWTRRIRVVWWGDLPVAGMYLQEQKEHTRDSQPVTHEGTAQSRRHGAKVIYSYTHILLLVR